VTLKETGATAFKTVERFAADKNFHDSSIFLFVVTLSIIIVPAAFRSAFEMSMTPTDQSEGDGSCVEPIVIIAIISS
jgi:PII-like signaling protein